MNEVRWEYMFPDQLEEAFQRCPVVYFTYGLCEPHGPQNTLGLDALKAHAIACETARTFGGIVAPPDYWHIHEIGGYANWGEQYVGEVKRKWLTAVPPWVHFKNVCYHVRTADVTGFKAAVFITGHYGPNWEDLKFLLSRIQPYTKTQLFGLPDFEANDPGFDGDHQSGDHAGKVETSLLWALEPSCVDMSRLPQNSNSNPPDENNDDGNRSERENKQPVEGASMLNSPPFFAMGSDAYKSSRKVGERMVQDEVRWISAKAQSLLDKYDDTADAPGLPTFEAVEKFWQKEIQPHLSEFKSMSFDFDLGLKVDKNSVWYENWAVPTPK